MRKIQQINIVYFFKLIILEYQSKRSSKKLGDFGIVNIVQEATPISPDNQPIISSNQSTINEEQTTTHQLAEQTSQMLDDIRKYKIQSKKKHPISYVVCLNLSFFSSTYTC